jgi:hypothetical protein
MDLYAFGSVVLLVLAIALMFGRLSRPATASRTRGWTLSPVTERPIRSTRSRMTAPGHQAVRKSK